MSALDHQYKEAMTDLHKSNKDNLIFQASVECANFRATLAHMLSRPCLQPSIEKLDVSIRQETALRGAATVQLAGNSNLGDASCAVVGGASAGDAATNVGDSNNTISDTSAQEICKRVMLLRSDLFMHLVLNENSSQTEIGAAAAQFVKATDAKISPKYQLAKQVMARVFAVGSFGEAEQRPCEPQHTLPMSQVQPPIASKHCQTTRRMVKLHLCHAV